MLAPLRIVAVGYTDLFRGLPTILVVFLVCFGVPALNLQGCPTACSVALIGLVLSYGAYVAEVFRAGIESVHPSQVAGATALGLSHGQAMRHVVVPQAVRRVLPPLLNDFISLQKDTALVAAVSIFDALGTASDTANFNFNFTPYVVGGAVRRADRAAGPVHRLAGRRVGARAGGCPVSHAGAARCETSARRTATASSSTAST